MALTFRGRGMSERHPLIRLTSCSSLLKHALSPNGCQRGDGIALYPIVPARAGQMSTVPSKQEPLYLDGNSGNATKTDVSMCQGMCPCYHEYASYAS